MTSCSIKDLYFNVKKLPACVWLSLALAACGAGSKDAHEKGEESSINQAQNSIEDPSDTSVEGEVTSSQQVLAVDQDVDCRLPVGSLWDVLDRDRQKEFSKPAAYTQGLLVEQGWLFESRGISGRSGLAGFNLAQQDQAAWRQLYAFSNSQNPRLQSAFAEGLTVFEDVLLQLTWTDGVAIRYQLPGAKDLSVEVPSFTPTSVQPYESEGWGLVHVPDLGLLASDRSDVFWLEEKSLKRLGTLQVRERLNDGRLVELQQVNEMEWVDGQVWANIYKIGADERVVRFHPQTGCVTASLKLTDVFPYPERRAALTNPVLSNGQRQANDWDLVANGIAFDGRYVYLTGKNWNRLYRYPYVSLVE